MPLTFLEGRTLKDLEEASDDIVADIEADGQVITALSLAVGRDGGFFLALAYDEVDGADEPEEEEPPRGRRRRR